MCFKLSLSLFIYFNKERFGRKKKIKFFLKLCTIYIWVKQILFYWNNWPCPMQLIEEKQMSQWLWQSYFRKICKNSAQVSEKFSGFFQKGIVWQSYFRKICKKICSGKWKILWVFPKGDSVAILFPKNLLNFCSGKLCEKCSGFFPTVECG